MSNGVITINKTMSCVNSILQNETISIRLKLKLGALIIIMSKKDETDRVHILTFILLSSYSIFVCEEILGHML